VPAMVFIFAIRLALALPLYWLTSSVVAYIQQARVLKEDADEADATVDSGPPKSNQPSITTKGGLKVTRKTLGAETKSLAAKTSSKNKKASRNKRRRR